MNTKLNSLSTFVPETMQEECMLLVSSLNQLIDSFNKRVELEKEKSATPKWIYGIKAISHDWFVLTKKLDIITVDESKYIFSRVFIVYSDGRDLGFTILGKNNTSDPFADALLHTKGLKTLQDVQAINNGW